MKLDPIDVLVTTPVTNLREIAEIAGSTSLCEPMGTRNHVDAGILRSVTWDVSFVSFELPEIRYVEFPVERFVVYEQSDAAWAVPLGIAKERWRPLDLGDHLSFEVRRGDTVTAMRGVVRGLWADQGRDGVMRYRVEVQANKATIGHRDRDSRGAMA